MKKSLPAASGLRNQTKRCAILAVEDVEIIVIVIHVLVIYVLVIHVIQCMFITSSQSVEGPDRNDISLVFQKKLSKLPAIRPRGKIFVEIKSLFALKTQPPLPIRYFNCSIESFARRPGKTMCK